MSRCPHLDYEGNKYICKKSNKEMYADDAIVKFTCKSDSGDEYKKCRVYKN